MDPTTLDLPNPESILWIDKIRNALFAQDFFSLTLILEHPPTSYLPANTPIAKLFNSSDPEAIKHHLSDPNIDPSSQNNFAIRSACFHGIIDSVKLLLLDPRVDPSDGNSDSLIFSTLFCTTSSPKAPDHFAIMELLLSDPRVDPSLNELFSFCCYLGNRKLVECFLFNEKFKIKTNFSQNEFPPLSHAIQEGYLSLVKILLSNKKIDPSIKKNHAILTASKSKNQEFMKLLLSDPRVNPADNDSEALSCACEYNNSEIVTLLLLDERCNPMESKIIEKLPYCDLQTVKSFLSSSLADPSGQFILERIAESQNLEVATYLLSDKRVNPGVFDNQLLFDCCSRRFWEFVKLLIVDARVDVSARRGTAFLLALRDSKDPELIKLFLSDKRIDPAEDDYEPVAHAIFSGTPEIITLFLEDKRVPFTEIKDKYIRTILEALHFDSVLTILSDPRAKGTIDTDWIVCWSIENTEFGQSLKLLSHPTINYAIQRVILLRNGISEQKFSEPPEIWEEIIKKIYESQINFFMTRRTKNKVSKPVYSWKRTLRLDIPTGVGRTPAKG